MGRKVRRVALDFDWPLNVTWHGFVNPWDEHSSECEACAGSGYSPEAHRFKDQWYGNAPFNAAEYGSDPVITIDNPVLRASVERKIRNCDSDYYFRPGELFESAVNREVQRMYGIYRNSWCHQLSQADVDALVAADRLWDFTRVPRNDEQREIVRKMREERKGCWLPEPNNYHPTAAEVNAWSLNGFGHDGINQGVCVRARCEREGVIELCAKCSGNGSIWTPPESEDKADAWESIEPPAGEGWQMWETVSEGSPISPVFHTADELARWLTDTNASAFGGETATYEQWLGMCQAGWAPSAVMSAETGLISGVAAVAASDAG